MPPPNKKSKLTEATARSPPQLQSNIYRLLCLSSEARKSIIEDGASILLLIPQEIRDKIYEYVFTGKILYTKLRDEKRRVSLRGPPATTNNAEIIQPASVATTVNHQRPDPSLATFHQVCRQIHNEALPVLYSLVELQIRNSLYEVKEHRVPNLRHSIAIDELQATYMANFQNITLFLPHLGWSEVKIVQKLSSVCRLMIKHCGGDRNEGYSFPASVQLSSTSINVTTGAFAGASYVIKSVVGRPGVYEMETILRTMRSTRGTDTGSTRAVTLVVEFDLWVSSPNAVHGHWEIRSAPSELVLSNENVFTLKYTYEGVDYEVNQLPLRGH